MITIACVLKSGGDYDTDYVCRLQEGVAAYLSVPHRFVCLSDVDVPCERIPLVHGWPGWWAKMELFKLPGPLLYFDLDTIIVASIDQLAARVIAPPYNHFVMLRDFYRQDRSSGILGWSGDVSEIFDEFEGNYAAKATFERKPKATYMIVDGRQFRGDQEWLQVYLKSMEVWLSVTMAQDVMPGIYSYKVDIKKMKGLPQDAKIICFHGRPRPAELSANHELRKCWCKRAKSESRTG